MVTSDGNFASSEMAEPRDAISVASNLPPRGEGFRRLAKIRSGESEG
eukprot:CAMPEP_0119353404 /NCGR_PEP_ID=MMETSP1334-20130426/2548_1 /TAXON_ID=127549 /ORGANISM="Calcidiscus leptoporus, Strain RCC1130" /LENGTH=46 /DNA_ID= /DNA_START= /DNA_END= /DNA_ORIENTATION=